jgi:hypothetical protein
MIKIIPPPSSLERVLFQVTLSANTLDISPPFSNLLASNYLLIHRCGGAGRKIFVSPKTDRSRR